MNVFKQLQLFSETVDELRNTNVIKKGLTSDMTIKSAKVQFRGSICGPTIKVAEMMVAGEGSS